MQLLGVIFSFASTISCLNVNEMFLYDYDSTVGSTVKTEVTTYIQVMACVSLSVNTLGLFLSIINTIFASNSLKNLNNKLSRHTLGKHTRTMDSNLPLHLERDQIKSYMP